VPSADTSQALNRYAYVKNNPLKFTDPSGHGWFSKHFKKWIGTIVTVGLIVFAPWSGPLAFAIYGAIGAAVSTAVNGGNLKSFAIGIAIGAVSGAIVGCAGGYLAGGAKAFGAWVEESIINAAIIGAITGAISGAISSAVYGGDTWRNVGEGALAGGIAGAAVGAAKQYRGDIATFAKKMADGIAKILADTINLANVVVDDIVSHFQVDAQVYVKGINETKWRIANVKAFKSHNFNSSAPWAGAQMTVDAHTIHVGEDFLAMLKTEVAIKSSAGQNLMGPPAPVSVEGGTLGSDFSMSEIMAHEGGHTPQAANMGTLRYWLKVGSQTLKGEAGSPWERDASRNGQFGGFVK
jgi:hypothetical protein